MENNDALKVAPEVHTLLLENEKVRVLDVHLATGKKAEMHWHPDSISYILQGGKMRITRPIGPIAEVELVTATAMGGTEGEHMVENIGSSEIDTIQIELK